MKRERTSETSPLKEGRRAAPIPSIAVTIPTKNSAKALRVCLESVSSSEVPMEILVADDCSTDGTQQVAKSFGARVLEGPLPLLEARYQALKASVADCVLMLDSDQTLEPGALGQCIQSLKHYDALVLEETSSEETTWVARLYAADKRYLHAVSDFHMDPVRGSLLPRAFRRRVLEVAFASIPEKVRRAAVAQDHAIIYEEVSRITTSVGLVPAAVRHSEMESLRELWRKYLHWGAGLVELFAIAPQYRNLSSAKMRGRFHRGGAPIGDFLASLMLLVLKSVPYSVGYGSALLARRITGWRVSK